MRHPVSIKHGSHPQHLGLVQGLPAACGPAAPGASSPPGPSPAPHTQLPSSPRPADGDAAVNGQGGGRRADLFRSPTPVPALGTASAQGFPCTETTQPPRGQGHPCCAVRRRQDPPGSPASSSAKTTSNHPPKQVLVPPEMPPTPTRGSPAAPTKSKLQTQIFYLLNCCPHSQTKCKQLPHNYSGSASRLQARVPTACPHRHNTARSGNGGHRLGYTQQVTAEDLGCMSAIQRNGAAPFPSRRQKEGTK